MTDLTYQGDDYRAFLEGKFKFSQASAVQAWYAIGETLNEIGEIRMRLERLCAACGLTDRQPIRPSHRSRPRRPVDRFRAGKRLWSPEDDALLRERYPHEATSSLAVDLRRSVSSVYGRAANLGLEKTEQYLASPEACRLRRGDDVGAKYRFAKGHVPANKGLRRPGYGPGRMRETQFRKGQVSLNYMPVGTTRLVDGYLYRKVTDTPNVPWTRNWVIEHRLVWEAANGPLPPGHAIAFKNGDRTDVRLGNLERITRRELMARNTIHNLPKELANAIQLLGALTRQINRRSAGQ